MLLILHILREACCLTSSRYSCMCSKVLMTEQYAVSLPYAADVSLLSIFSGSKAQLGSMLTGKNKLRNVALDAQGGEPPGPPALHALRSRVYECEWNAMRDLKHR